jgi:periplasmic divalent cation tolerance protein
VDLPQTCACGRVTEQVVIALSTFPDAETAKRISRELVQNALVACANIISPIESIYFWKDKIEESGEVLAIFKLPAAGYAQFEKRLHSLHPYDVPEILRIEIAGGPAEYLRWVSESCARS